MDTRKLFFCAVLSIQACASSSTTDYEKGCNSSIVDSQVECLKQKKLALEKKLQDLNNESQIDYASWRKELKNACNKVVYEALGSGISADQLACYDEKYTLRINELQGHNKSVIKKDKLSQNSLLIEVTEQKVSCYLNNCAARPFTESLYDQLFKDDTSLSGLLMGTYYVLPNKFGLTVYIGMYTDEGETSFNYLIVNDGQETRYIQLPINFWIDNNLSIEGYNVKGKKYIYQVMPSGYIINK